MSTFIRYSTASQSTVDHTVTLIRNRLLDLNDFFNTGDFEGTCNIGDLLEFDDIKTKLEGITDRIQCTGSIGKVIK